MAAKYKEVTSKYIQESFEPKDRLAVVIIDQEGRTQQKIVEAQQLASERYLAYLAMENARNAGVFVTANTLQDAAHTRTKDDIKDIRHLYLDLDKGGQEALRRVTEAPDLPKPTHIVETSPGHHHVVWRVEGFEQAQAEKTMKGMARQYDADIAATDSARCLRLPGFRNTKYEKPHYVTATAGGAERVYNPKDFPTYDIEQSGGGRGGIRRSSSGGQSQSEKDFAYTMRALERGESPEVIKMQIEHFRPDKANPRSYAQTTVDNAMRKYSENVSRAEVLEVVQRSNRTIER